MIIGIMTGCTSGRGKEAKQAGRQKFVVAINNFGQANFFARIGRRNNDGSD